MIDHKPLISEALAEMGIKSVIRNGRGRCRCPIHEGENLQAFSFDDDKGLWFCHRCGIGGDVFDLMMKVRGCDFTGALRFFGLEPGKPPAPDPEMIRKRKIKAGLIRWAECLGRQLRFEFRTREAVITRAVERLCLNHEDEWGWTWLQWAFCGKDQIEMLLDSIDIGTEAQRLQAYREWRRAA